jgi:hypothetical protein
MPEAPTTPATPATPDAIRAPRTAGGFAALPQLQSAYAAVLGVPRVYVWNQGSEHFITGKPGEQLYFPATHPASGQSRYRWEDQGGGVFFGFLIPESDLPTSGTGTADVLAILREFQAKREEAQRAGKVVQGAPPKVPATATTGQPTGRASVETEHAG